MTVCNLGGSNHKTIRIFGAPKRDKDTKEVIDYSADEAKIRRMQKGFGFFAIVTYRLDEYQPLPVLKIYALRGEQEQAFEVMKEINGMDKHNCWSEDGMFGRRFIYRKLSCLLCKKPVEKRSGIV